MALYSVWDWDRNAWAIYRTPDSVSVGDDPTPPRPSVGPLGADPDTQVKPLPSGAKLIGYDHMARGEVRRIASLPLGLDSPEQGDIGKYIVGFITGAVCALFLSRKERR